MHLVLHEVHRDLLTGDPDLPLAEVDVHLPGRSIEPDRRPGGTAWHSGSQQRSIESRGPSHEG
jgi:hypothetical protein